MKYDDAYVMKAVLAERQRCAKIARRVLDRERTPVQRRIAREIARRIEGKPVRVRARPPRFADPLKKMADLHL